MITQSQLDAFHQFAIEQVGNGLDASLSELIELWELQNTPSSELDENVAAIQASIDDMLNGETGRPASEFIQELRTQLNAIVES